MKELLKHFKYLLIGEIVFDSLLWLYGLFLLLFPQTSTKLACQCLGILILVSSFYNVFKYLFESRISFYKYDILTGILSLLLGLFIIVKPNMFYSLLIYAVSIWLLFNGIRKIYISIKLYKFHDGSFPFSLTLACIILALSILMIFNPFAAKLAFTAFSGIILLFTHFSPL